MCTRYINSRTEEAASLYFSSGTRFESYKTGHYRMIKADRREDIVVVASGELTRVWRGWGGKEDKGWRTSRAEGRVCFVISYFLREQDQIINSYSLFINVQNH